MKTKTPAEIAMAKGYKCQRCKGTKFHMWSSPQYTEHMSCDKCGYAEEIMPQSFVAWWRNHRDSGYAEKNGLFRYNILPPEAWNVHRYRLEFSDTTGHYYDPLEYRFSAGQRMEWPHYTGAEKAQWSRVQDQVEDMTEKLEEIYGREFWKQMTPAEFFAAVKKEAKERGMKLGEILP